MASASAVAAKPPKHIHVNGKRVKFRLVQNIAWSVVCAAIGTYMITALYYLILEVRWPGTGSHTILYLKPSWDGLIKHGWWENGRHDYRDCYEAVFAILFVRSIITKHKGWHKHVGWVRLVTAPFVLFAVAFPIITLGIYLIDIHTWSVPGWIVTYQAVIIGAVAAHVVRPIFTPVGNTVQQFFLDQALAGHHRPKWPLPPTVRERYAWMVQSGDVAKDYGRWFTIAVSVMALILFALAVYGGYVHWFIARGLHLL